VGSEVAVENSRTDLNPSGTIYLSSTSDDRYYLSVYAQYAMAGDYWSGGGYLTISTTDLGVQVEHIYINFPDGIVKRSFNVPTSGYYTFEMQLSTVTYNGDWTLREKWPDWQVIVYRENRPLWALVIGPALSSVGIATMIIGYAKNRTHTV
jgi:hypothetical protein